MKLNPSDLLLYAVTDRSWLGNSSLLEQVEESILGGVTCVQLREKDLDNHSFLSEAKEMKSLCHKYNIPFIINDSVEIAVQSGADGVHIGQSDPSGKATNPGHQILTFSSVSTKHFGIIVTTHARTKNRLILCVTCTSLKEH